MAENEKHEPIIHYLLRGAPVRHQRTGCGACLTEPRIADDQLTTERERTTCPDCRATLSDPAMVQRIREQGLPRTLTVELDDGRVLKVDLSHWLAWYFGSVFCRTLDEKFAPHSLEWHFPTAEGSSEQLTVVVTAIRPGSDSPTVRLQQAKWLLTHATTYTFTDADPTVGEFYVELTDDNKQLWAIRREPRLCLSRDGAWDHEPMQSHREEDWLAAHRWTAEEALPVALRRVVKEADHVG